MAFGQKAGKKWDEFKQKLQDKKNQERVREEIAKRLQQGKEAIERLEKELRDPENQARFENKVRDMKARLEKAKKEFHSKKEQAVAYARENPEKGLVVAAAAGALMGALWAAFRRKK